MIYWSNIILCENKSTPSAINHKNIVSDFNNIFLQSWATYIFKILVNLVSTKGSKSIILNNKWYFCKNGIYQSMMRTSFHISIPFAIESCQKNKFEDLAHFYTIQPRYLLISVSWFETCAGTLSWKVHSS